MLAPDVHVLAVRAQPDLTLKCMYFTGLIITAVDVLVALAVTNNGARSDRAD
jgi:hypothetical protein